MLPSKFKNTSSYASHGAAKQSNSNFDKDVLLLDWYSDIGMTILSNAHPHADNGSSFMVAGMTFHSGWEMHLQANDTWILNYII